MKEGAFIRINKEKWQNFEKTLNRQSSAAPDNLAEIYIKITDDLSFAQSHFPSAEVTVYLNELASRIHQSIYKNKKEDTGRMVRFWTREIPLEVGLSMRYLLYSFIIFMISAIIGAVSAAHDDTFIRLIMGDAYVNLTLENINKGDPLAIYKSAEQITMFMGITFNNIMVSFYVFAAGVLTPFATGYMLLKNGIMIGAFQYFMYQQGFLADSLLTIWIHGTLEISSIIIAGGAGLLMGSSFIFPGTYSRMESFRRGARRGMKIVIGLVPVFMLAGFLEGFVTRRTEWPAIVKICIIGFSALFIMYYFIYLPLKLRRNVQRENRAFQGKKLQ